MPVPITPEATRPRGLRYADGVVDTRRTRMIWVREDHTTVALEPVNTLVEIPLDGSRPQRVLQSGRDFYAAPRLSADGGKLAWLEWNHPNMPWIGCELWVAECAADGLIGNKRLIAGGKGSRSFNPNGRPTAPYISSPIALRLRLTAGGGTCSGSAATPWTLLRRSTQFIRWRGNSAEHSGSSGCPPSRSPHPASSSARMCRTGFTG